MNGGHGRAPGAGSSMLTSCSSQKICSWMVSCCLALQVRAGTTVSSQRDGMMRRGLGSSQIAGQGLHPARQRVGRAVVTVCWEGSGQ